MVAEPVGRAVDADHRGPVQEPVQHRRGDGGVPERRGPVRDADVGAQDCAGLQIPLIDHLEQRRRAILRQWQLAELINDQKPGTCEGAHARLPAALKGGLVALGRQLGCGGEVDPVAGVDRGPAERDGQHGLAHPGRPDEQHVRRVVQEPQGAGPGLALVGPGLGREVSRATWATGQANGTMRFLLALQQSGDLLSDCLQPSSSYRTEPPYAQLDDDLDAVNGYARNSGRGAGALSSSEFPRTVATRLDPRFRPWSSPGGATATSSTTSAESMNSTALERS